MEDPITQPVGPLFEQSRRSANQWTIIAGEGQGIISSRSRLVTYRSSNNADRPSASS